jgi:hypothetical protein
MKITRRTSSKPKAYLPAALSYESLLGKSRIHAQRAVAAKNAGMDDDYQLYASLALELLAKASLAAIHPSLIVEPENTNSLLEACGFSTGTVVRSIKAQDAYARLKHTVNHFGTPAYDDCRKLAERRNAELHSGEAAFSSMPPTAWEGSFWNSAELVLGSLKLNLDEWLAVDATTPKQVLKAMRAAKSDAARERIKHAAEEFKRRPDGQKRGKAEIEKLREASKGINPFDSRGQFHYLLSKYWLGECPACKCSGVLGGDPTFEEPAEDQSGADDGFEIIESGYNPVEFHCPTCALVLVGEEALSLADLGDEYIETVEREIEYGPDYGND